MSKGTRSALQNAADPPGRTGLLLTTEVLIADKPEDKPAAPAGGPGGGDMGGMY